MAESYRDEIFNALWCGTPQAKHSVAVSIAAEADKEIAAIKDYLGTVDEACRVLGDHGYGHMPVGIAMRMLREKLGGEAYKRMRPEDFETKRAWDAHEKAPLARESESSRLTGPKDGAK